MEKPELINILEKDKYGKSKGLFQCPFCRNQWITRIESVEKGYSKSCGCHKKQQAADLGKRNKKHGLTETSEYAIWVLMRQRCNNLNNDSYEDYGARGIRVCQLWQYSFEDFYKDMGPRPSKDHSIHRIDNDNGYYPKNCKWAIWEEQGRAKRNNRLLTFKGETRCLNEWSDITGINRGTIFSRLKMGWDVEKTLSTPDSQLFVMITFNNKTQSIQDWAKELNIDPEILYNRRKRGWNDERMLTQPVKKYTKKNS